MWRTKVCQKSKSLIRRENKIELILSGKVIEKKGKGCVSEAWKLAQEYGKATNVHGLDRILAWRLGLKQRLLWTVVFVVALVVLIWESLMLADRYNKKQLQTVIDSTNEGVYKIPYPEIVICNQNRLNWSRLSQAEELFLRPSHYSEPYRSTFERVIALFDTLSFGKFDRFAILADLAPMLAHLNYINLTEVVDFMAWRCDEILTDCFWHQMPFACCDIFLPRPTQMGRCLSFNTIVTPEGKVKQAVDSKWPWRIGNSGPGSALKVKVELHEENHSPFSFNEKGVNFQLVEPYVWFSYALDLLSNTHNSVAISAVLHFYDENTRRLSSSERECVFQDEQDSSNFKTMPGQKYMYENCLSQCQQEHLVQFCNCSLDMFYPPNMQITSCKMKDLLCLAQFNDILRNVQEVGEKQYVSKSIPGLECNCYLNCNSLTYIKDTPSTPFDQDERLVNNSFVSMDFFFKNSYMFVFRTSLIYTWVDLLGEFLLSVSFGGVTALFIGCSLISLIELCYFLCVNTPTWFWKKCKKQQRKHLKRRKSQEVMHKLLTEITIKP